MVRQSAAVYFNGILTTLDFWRLNSAVFAGFVIHGPVWRAEEQNNSHTQQLFKFSLYIRNTGNKMRSSQDVNHSLCCFPSPLLTIFYGHKWRDVIMEGVHCLDGLVPITGHKHSDYQNNERLTGPKKCFIMWQSATFPRRCLCDCCWHQTEPVQANQTDY